MKSLLIIYLLLCSFSVCGQENRVLTIQDPDLIISVFFGGGSWYVDEVQAEKVQRFLEGFEDLSKYEITIHSHTDNIGGKEYNQWLSQMRGQAVFQILLLNNIPIDQITIEDFGLDNPLYDNKSWRGKVMNRRVDVVLWPISF